MPLRISSLHDDLLWPCVSHACGMGEFDGSGHVSNAKRSPLVRAAQFGVDDSTVWTAPLPGSAAYVQYCAALVLAVSGHYETVVAAIFDRYFTTDPGCGWPPSPPTRTDLEHSVQEDLKRYLSFASCGLTVAKTSGDVQENGPTNLVLAIEGMDCIHSEAQIDGLLLAGVRIFALQYNRPNALSRGDCTTRQQAADTGLTPLGRCVIARLFAAGAIVDLAHTAQAARAEILQFAEEQGYGPQIAYTHGAVFEEAGPERVARLPGRFLHRDEAQRILKLGGIVGLTPARLFTDSLANFAAQVRRLFRETENGTARIALGTDFGGIWEGGLLPEVQSVRDLGRIGDTLAEQQNFTDTEIDAVLRANATNWLRQTLPISEPVDSVTRKTNNPVAPLSR